MRECSFYSLGAHGFPRGFPHGFPHSFHRIAYTEWGDADSERVVICVHGLTRNGRDFDTLARSLASDVRVLCPDVFGRGRSDWLADKKSYGYAIYLADMAALIARSGATEVHWVGTSMGGLIGMLLAAMPGSPITKLVLNDVGPFIPKAALERIASYVGGDPRFPDVAALDAYLREIYVPFGPYTERQWLELVHSSVRHTPQGDIALNYDPGIATPFEMGPLDDVDLWASWDAIACPVLLLRGQTSDLLPAATAAQMQRRGPGAANGAGVRFVECEGVGHAPSLVSDDQVALVREWLLDAVRAGPLHQRPNGSAGETAEV
ncbi:MAG: alpha/beta fold hydrolase [Gammaproteobacteria bacterium]